MKKIYQGILFVAFLAVAIYGVGGQEPNNGGGFTLALCGLFVIMGLMAGSGMIAKPVSKKEYERIYNKKV